MVRQEWKSVSAVCQTSLLRLPGLFVGIPIDWFGLDPLTEIVSLAITSAPGFTLAATHISDSAAATHCFMRPIKLRLRQVFVVGRVSLLLLLVIVVVSWEAVALACPFCSALPGTLSDDLDEATAAVIARCESVSQEADGVCICRMRITEVVKGDDVLVGTVVETVSTQEFSRDFVYWMVGFGEAPIQWAPPTKMTAGAISYVQGLRNVSESGPERLEYFLGYLRHADEFVAADAYNEFAEASLEDIAGLKSKLDRKWVISQLRGRTTPLHRRRLCWTFLSQCGLAKDASLFDELIHRCETDPAFEPGMDAAIACLISLDGERALARIERDFLANPAADYSDSFAAISAIRVHGTELRVIPRARLARSLRRVLDRPTLADLVISDLARWEDWSAIDRMAALFELSTEETRFLKPAVVLYLKNCPLPAAQKSLDKLRAIDSKSVRSAEASMMFYAGHASLPVPPPDHSTSQERSTVPKVAESSERQ